MQSSTSIVKHGTNLCELYVGIDMKASQNGGLLGHPSPGIKLCFSGRTTF